VITNMQIVKYIRYTCISRSFHANSYKQSVFKIEISQ